MIQLFKKKIPILFSEENGKPLMVEFNDSGLFYEFKLDGRVAKTDDYNPRSQLYRFTNFVLCKVANHKKNFVAYEIVGGDLELITNSKRFIEVAFNA